VKTTAKKVPAKKRVAVKAAPAKPAPAAPAKKSAGLDQSALQRLAGYSLRRAEVMMRQHFTRTLADWDIRGAEYSALVLTATNSLVTQADLGEALNIKRPNMVSLIERLEKRGLIARKVHEHDRRNHILSLTEKGEALLADIEGPVHELDKRVTSCWSAKERALVVELLQRFYLGE
jgi:DNA-binding MarR family transcriptional regulator